MMLTVASGRCAPTLLEDLTLHNLDRPSPPGFNLIRDNVLSFSRGQTLSAFLHPHNCRHVFWTKPRQSDLPALDELPDSHTKWSVAAVCGKCRTHLNLNIDYSDGWQPSPCPNTENPLHHFVRAQWKEAAARRVWEERMLGSPAEITVFQCSAKGCSARLTVRYTPPVLQDDVVHTLTDREILRQRSEAAFKANEGNTQGMKQPTIIDVLSDLRVYISNAWNKGQARRAINMTNKRFMVRFGPNGDACKEVLETLRFQRDVANNCWQVPEPDFTDSSPLQDPVNLFLDDVEHELLALMLSRPAEELQNLNDLRAGPLATRDLQRLCSAQDYETAMFSRTNKADPSQRPAAYVGLGIVPDAADRLIQYAYQRQVANDESNVPYYFEFLRDIALERRSEILQTEVSMEESMGRFSAKALEQAFSSFGISRHDTLDDDNIIGMFQSRAMDMPAHESELRQSLRIVGAWRRSHKILAIADNVMNTHEQALQFLGADPAVSDDYIQALFTSKIVENKAMEEQAKKAVRLIAQNRNSILLNRWINSNFSGDLNMLAPEGYQALSLNEDVDDETVKVSYEFNIMEQPENREYYAKALEAIAIQRNSFVLRDLLQGTARPTQEVVGRDDEPVGLDNIGNTCYLNSLLQFLFTVAELRRIVLDFDQFKMDITDAKMANKKVGQRQVTRREVQTAQDFVNNLGQLFRGMIESSSSTIKPAKELARLTLETHGAQERMRRRSTLMSDRPSLGHLDSQPVFGPQPNPDQKQAPVMEDSTVMESPAQEEPTAMQVDDPNQNSDSSLQYDKSDNSSEATLVSRPATPGTPVTVEQQKELLDNKENLSPTKLDESPKHGDLEGEHPEPLAPASPSKVNSQAGALAKHQKDREPYTDTVEPIEATPKYAPPPGKPPPVPPRKPAEPTTDILEEYARQQDVTEVIAHCLFQFSCAIRGTGVDASGEQLDEVHDTFFGQNVIHTVPEKEAPAPIQFNNIITRVANKPKDVYDALDSELDLTEREGGSKAFISISRLPPIFSMALDRVAWDKTAKRPMKQDDHVQIPERIYLDRYLEAEPNSNLMERRKQSWAMKSELAGLIDRRDKLETKVANGRDLPTLFADAKLALEYLQTNPDFTSPDSDSDEDLERLLDPTIAVALGALADDLAVELKSVNTRIAYIEQQLKESFADMREHPYRLHAAFFHRGGATGGHYWVYIFDHVKECWRRYNDDHVNVVSDLNELFGKPDGTSGTPNPYFLVYVREDKAKSLVETVKRDIVYSAPDGPPPSAQLGHSDAEAWKSDSWAGNRQPQSQMEAMPPGAGQEMMEINGGVGAWNSECSDSGSSLQKDRHGVEDKFGAWDNSQLTTDRRINW
ncbi:uncharacterized protein HMPREF1541_08299 [Cyphellophora europaea CBS 101466]|uniref:ubiquitinyl hydrolase 1 n=1 Tax=Cyphellophora europaea (strain CBS 101466) TaxID=1220924 RepID=W2RNN4_CYPE1|nr:uncharacterized protein HMPREF1541_08299 [Cyphellophora europaea CBS 101466]ETN37308.1 hypothetical protein HMPREF1541_08299 [Cyphellophora europaea CBS 101466]